MAALVAKNVLARAVTLLQDAGNARWSLEELTDALNDGLLEICLHKPSACSETVVLDLAEGTYQTLADGHTQLIRVIRNITSATGVTPRVAGRVVSPVDREIIDGQIPGWHDANTVPFSPLVMHVITDPMNPTDFYVFPGNDGTGQIEAAVAVQPTPVTLGSAPTDISTYTDEIDIAPVYQSALIDYILYRAYSKDAQIAGAAQRAVAHYQNFLTALGVRRQVEAAATPATT